MPSKNRNTSFNSSGLPIPGDASRNLCMQAYYLLSQDFDLPSVKIHLHKIIPLGAGLGGGSSDAAHTLLLLNDLFNLKLDQEQLLSYASILGADCAFFLKNKPTFAFAKGDQFEDVNINLDPYQIVIVKPEIHVATSEAYAGISPAVHLFPLKKLIEKPLDEWQHTLKNDFETSIFAMYPEIEKIKNTFYRNGASYASMSGSGSSVFALFKNPIDLSSQFNDYFYWSSKM